MSISWTTSASRYSIGHRRSAPSKWQAYMSYGSHIDRNNVSKSVVDACASQVEYLCAHGADVYRGLRSSSLHYAACFRTPSDCSRMTTPCLQCCNVHTVRVLYIRFRRRIFILLIITYSRIACSSILLTFPANSPRNKLTSTYLSSLSLLTPAPTSTVVALVFHVHVLGRRSLISDQIASTVSLRVRVDC